jgi:hypothetical protein
MDLSRERKKKRKEEVKNFTDYIKLPALGVTEPSNEILTRGFVVDRDYFQSQQAAAGAEGGSPVCSCAYLWQAV